MTLGEKIKALMEERNISAEKLAGELDVTVSTVYYMYKKDSVETKYLIKISEMTGVSASELLDLETQPSTSKISNINSESKNNSNALLKAKDKIIEEQAKVISAKDQVIASQKEVIEMLKASKSE